jgi:hypothetical protein
MSYATALHVLKSNPSAAIRHELSDPFASGLKGEYLAIIDDSVAQLLQIDRPTADELARAGHVKADPFDEETRSYTYRQVDAPAN